MDEKTEELRDIFLDVTDEETVTESQEESRGSVADSGDFDEQRLAAAIAEMREKFAFETDLADEELQRLVQRFYGGDDDETIAERLSVSSETVFRARMDLHLVHDEDPPGIDVDEETWELFRTQQEADTDALADDVGLDSDIVERVRAVIDANARSRRASNRFRITFEECLTDADLSTQLASDTHRDGLADATEDAEVDVDF